MFFNKHIHNSMSRTAITLKFIVSRLLEKKGKKNNNNNNNEDDNKG